MKKNRILLIITLAVLVIAGACKEDFLTITPNGALDQEVLATEAGVNGLLIGAYSMLDGISGSIDIQATASNWIWGDMRGMIANKGTDAGDMSELNEIQTFSESATNSFH